MTKFLHRVLGAPNRPRHMSPPDCHRRASYCADRQPPPHVLALSSHAARAGEVLLRFLPFAHPIPHLIASLCAAPPLRCRGAAGPSDPKEAPRVPMGLRRPVLHPRAKPLHCEKGLKPPDTVHSSVVTTSHRQLLHSRPPVKPAPHRAPLEYRTPP
jgi:hypothetical protein